MPHDTTPRATAIANHAPARAAAADGDEGGAPYSSRDHVTKRRASVQREVARLLDALAPERPVAHKPPPESPVRRYRSPGRCILQGAEGAVSVSWFPGLPGDDSLGELLVIHWRGIVALPGAPRASAGAAAEPVRTIVLHPVPLASGEWEWHAASDAPQLGIDALAAHCCSLVGVDPR